MGSDIYTESAVAVRLDDFLNVDAIKKKAARELITNVFYQEKLISDYSFTDMNKSKNLFIETFIHEMSMSEEGYEADEERNRYMIQTFCDVAKIDLEDLPEFSLRRQL